MRKNYPPDYPKNCVKVEEGFVWHAGKRKQPLGKVPAERAHHFGQVLPRRNIFWFLEQVEESAEEDGNKHRTKDCQGPRPSR